MTGGTKKSWTTSNNFSVYIINLNLIFQCPSSTFKTAAVIIAYCYHSEINLYTFSE